MDHPSSLNQSSIDSRLSSVKDNIHLQIRGLFSLAFAIYQVSAIFLSQELLAYFGGPVKLQAEHPAYYTLVCLIVGAMIALGGFYALFGAGKFRRLPLMRNVLVIVTTIYILRGLKVLPDFIFILRHPQQHFMHFFVFSTIALCIGFIHLVGVIKLFRHGRPESVT